MKPFLCFLALLLTFASCDTSFRPHVFYPEIPQDSLRDSHQVMAEFYEGLFSRFGLDKPNQIIHECLSNFSSVVFLGELFTFNQLLNDINMRNFEHARQNFIKELILSILGHGAADCIVATQDFSNLVKALGIKRDPLLDNVAQSLYFQADFPTLLEDYKPVLQNIGSGNYSAAGAAYGDILSHTVETVKSKGFSYLAHTGMSNGFSFGLDIDLPSDTLTIWNDTTAAYDLEFVYESSKAVADGHWWESYQNYVKYYEDKGADVLSKIPASVREALQASEDNKKVTERLGVDVLTKEFGELAGAWIKRNPWKFHSYSKQVLKNLEHLDMIHAGAIRADFVWDIVKSK